MRPSSVRSRVATVAPGRGGVVVLRAVLAVVLIVSLGIAWRYAGSGKVMLPAGSSPCIETMRRGPASPPSPSDSGPDVRLEDAGAPDRCPQAGERVSLLADARGVFCDAHGLVATPGPTAYGCPLVDPAGPPSPGTNSAGSPHLAEFEAALASVTVGSAEARLLAELCYEIALEHEIVPLAAFAVDRKTLSARAREEIRDLPDLADLGILRTRFLDLSVRAAAAHAREPAVRPAFGQAVAALAAHRAGLLGRLGEAGSRMRTADAAGLVLVALFVLGYSLEIARFPLSGTRKRVGYALVGVLLGMIYTRLVSPEILLERWFVEPWTSWKLALSIRVAVILLCAHLSVLGAGDSARK